MTPLTYPARIEQVSPDEFLVTFADVPQALTGGATYEEALVEAADVISVAIEGLFLEGAPLPSPRMAGPGEVDVALSPMIAARVLLAREMQRQHVTGRSLGKRWRKDEKTVRRVLSGKGASLDLTLQALQVLGVRPALALP
jgi:antitoxin HicB